MKNVAIYCGSSKGNNPLYTEAAKKLGSELVRRKMAMIYGAGSVGLMGEIADEMMKQSGEVIGIIPQFLMDIEVGHENISQLEVVEDMHIRKARMIELSDGFIAMPGGFGTLDEIFEALTWKQLEIHSKPVAFYNVHGYYDSLTKFMGDMVNGGFVKEQYVNEIIIESDPEKLLECMLAYNKAEMKSGKWL